MSAAQTRPVPGDRYQDRNGQLLEVGAVWAGGVVFAGIEAIASHQELTTHYTKQERHHAAAQR